MEANWYKLKFFESTVNLKKAVKKSVGREPSTKIASEISACLTQGRLFFEAATKSPIEIKPLQLFYGIVGLSKAIVLARKIVGNETLDQTHGIRDISPQNASIEGLKLKILKRGTFQQFNDVISQFDCVHYFDKDLSPLSCKITSDNSIKLIGKEIIIKEVFARIPGLNDLYQSTFEEQPNNLRISFEYHEPLYCFLLRIDDQVIYTNRESLIEIVKKWRIRYPFLKNWCFYQASKQWGKSIIYFVNIDKRSFDELSEEYLMDHDNRFVVAKIFNRDTPYNRRDISEILPPISGGLQNLTGNIIDDYDGVFISEYSLYYLGMFLLSSLVRYRPQIWSHAITASATKEKPADNRAIALIEAFMDLAINEFPSISIAAMTSE